MTSTTEGLQRIVEFRVPGPSPKTGLVTELRRVRTQGDTNRALQCAERIKPFAPPLTRKCTTHKTHRVDFIKRVPILLLNRSSYRALIRSSFPSGDRAASTWSSHAQKVGDGCLMNGASPDMG